MPDPVDTSALTGGRQYHVVETESSAMFVVARRRGLRAGMGCAVSGNLVTGDVVHGEENTRLRTGWVHSVTAALEAVRALPA